MNNKEILQIAMAQSAEDIGCKAEDFTKSENVICKYHMGENARKYIKQPVIGNFVLYGSNTVAAVQDDIRAITEEYMKKFEFYHLFEAPNMHWLNKKLEEKGYGVCFMAEYYLPDKDGFYDTIMNSDENGHSFPGLPEGFEYKVLEQKDFAELYLPEWSNAICKERKELDVLGVGAYENEKLVGLAACSADCDDMWQIGIDVLPEYRRNGIASAITTRLAAEIMKKGKVPFYCTAWSNIRSVRNAYKCGFIPAWVEMTIKPLDAINKMNEGEA
ncbi:Acetyltransferase (GNAT) family protein [Lachnospiraceae bacterium]|nr:Acetyltransferase (GNAT) family protein [Lachnospiraceae bacterium]